MFVTQPVALPTSTFWTSFLGSVSPAYGTEQFPAANVCRQTASLPPTKTKMTEMPHLATTATLVLSKSRRLLKRSWFVLIALSLLIFPCMTFMMYQQVNASAGEPKKIPNIYILSHRRSGTHLTMDLLPHILPAPLRLVKTNHVYLTNSTDKKDVEEGINCRCLNFLRRTGKIVHAHRDVRDVVISSFYYYHSFKSALIRDLNKTAYLSNKNGVRDMVISKWVNTTVPFFAQPDIFQLSFTDSISGFAHIYERLAMFLGYDRARRLDVDPKKMNSTSKAVLRHGGKGDHGYKLEMPTSMQTEIIQLARTMQEETRRNMVDCPPRTSSLSRILDRVRDSFETGFWVGGSESFGLFAPSYCPAVMERSKVVVLE